MAGRQYCNEITIAITKLYIVKEEKNMYEEKWADFMWLTKPL